MAIFDQYTTLSLLNESILFNEKDIYYNKDKFDNGEINLCFITGHSGSGKSTMAKDMERKKEIESYELDDCDLIKDHFSMDNLKEYGDLYYSFFTGPGKKYYIGKEETEKWSNEESKEFWYNLINDIVHYAMQYAKSHSNKKYVINGVQLFQNSFKPEEFKDYAFYIKGTSLIISHIRATKRDAPDDGSKLGKARNFVKNISRIKYWRYCGIAEKAIQKFRKYFQGLIDEQKKSINEASLMKQIDCSKIFHISAQSLDKKTLHPSIPSNYFTKNGYEDNTTKRVCFAPSINQCLMGLSRNCTGEEFYVMSPDGDYDVYKPTVQEVPDSKVTGELWIMNPVKVKCIGKIKCTGDSGKPGHKFKYGDGKTAELYDWDYEFINK